MLVVCGIRPKTEQSQKLHSEFETDALSTAGAAPHRERDCHIQWKKFGTVENTVDGGGKFAQPRALKRGINPNATDAYIEVPLTTFAPRSLKSR
jgi:hypothetical protein